MQKKLMMIVILLLALSNRMAADDQLSISNFSIFTEHTKDVSITLANENAYAGFQFDLDLPEGVTVSSYSANSARITTASELSMLQQSDGTYRFVFLSQSATPLSGTSGDAIINLTLQAAATATVGSTTGYFKNIKLAKADGTGPTYTSQLFTFTVRGNEPYAVLSDENIKLTFYYDKQKDDRGGMDVGPFTNESSRGWNDYKETVETVVFDDTFASYTELTSTRLWFCNFGKLTTIDKIENLKTGNVADMYQMFGGCSSLESLDLSSFDTSELTDMSYMFSGCVKMRTLDLSSFNTSKVTNMTELCSWDEDLKTIYVGSGWDVSSVSLSGNTSTLFHGCGTLYGGKGTSYIKMSSSGGIKYACIDGGPNSDNPGYLTDIADKGKFFPYAVLSNDNKTLTFYYNGDRDNYNWMWVGETSDLSDKDWLGSAYATSITSVVFDDSFAGYTALSSTAFWFFGLSNLSSITGLNNLKTGNVTNMNSMLRGCQSLTTLDLSGFNTAKVTDMGSMFSGCSGLSTLTLGGSFDTGSVVYMNEMFQNCSSLTVLDLGSFNIAKVENMNSMFSNASNLKTIYVGTGWATTLETAGAEMFSGCTNLVGGSSTTYDVTNVGFDYARIDGGPSSETPGYFTDVANNGKEVYMVLTDSNSKLTFYYDANKASRSGTVVDLIGTSGYGWSSFKDYITSVEFDPSFADYHGLTSTKEWFMSCNNLSSVTGIVNLKTENVTDMTSMFQYCSALSSLDLSSLNTSNVTKMAHMFYDCQNLVSLNISGFNTAKVTGMDAMFYNCNKLESLNLSSFVTENVTNMQEMFWTCSSLTDIDVIGFETGSVTSMAQMFFGCSGLTTLDLSSFNTVNAVEMTGMFQDCSNLVTIYVGDNWSYEQAATGGNLMFDGCTSIVGGSGTEYSSANYDWRYAHVDGGTVNPGYLTDVKYKGKTDEAYAVLSSDSKTLTFYYDKDKEFRTGVVDIDTGSGLGWESYSSTITSVVFDDSFANYTSLTSTASWFMGCTNLTSITGIANLKTDNVTNMYAMFYNCSSLTSLDVSGFVTDNVTNMEKMFSACDFTTLDISNFKTDKVTNMKEMFRECRSLATLTLDKNNFKTDNVTNMWLMFKDCESLTSLDVSGFNTANVTDMTLMFHGCKELTTLDVSGFNTAKVTTMEGMFNGCEGLTTLDLSSFNTTLVTNMMSMFYGCTSLTTISVSDKWSNEGVAEGTSTSTNMFYNCTSLVGENGTTYDATRTNHLYAHIDIAGDPGYFTNVIPTEPYAALSDENTKLTFYYDKMKADRNGMSVGPFNAYFDIPWSDVRTSITTVKFDNSFANYTGLTSTKWMLGDLAYLESIEGIENLKTDNVTDMSYMFYACGITSLDLSSFNTTNVENMSSMFDTCLNLKTLDVSNFNTANVTDMSHMFYRCEKLENLNITNFVTSSVTDMSDMFHDCKTLTSLDLSSFNTEKVTQMGEFFWGDANLQTIIVGKGWSTAAITGTHEESTFKACNALVGENGTTYDESHIGIDYAHIDGGAENPGYFTDVRSKEPYAVLTDNEDDISIDGSTAKGKTLTFYYDKKKEDNNGLDVNHGWFEQRKLITSVVLDDSFAKCTTLTSLDSWFMECSNLKAITNISNLKTDNVTNMYRLFYGCSNLTEIDLSGFKTGNVSDMRYMFDSCLKLTTLDLSSFETDNVINMSSMFWGCSGLTDLNVSSFRTESVSNMSFMFYGCSSLTSIDVSNFNTSNVTDMRNMFSTCTNLTTIYVGENWSTTKVTTGEDMFSGCTSLVGSLGTTFNAEQMDYTFAHIDGGTDNPGYLTDKYGVILTVMDDSREYGAANPTFEYTATGVAISGKPTITCDATATSPVGTYPVKISYTKAEGESALNITCINGTLTITKAPLKVTAKSYTIKRGGTLPTFEVEYAGFKNNETEDAFKTKPTITCEAKPDTVPGTYQIVVSGAEADNYEMEYVFGSLTITDDAVVTANSYSRVYGDDNPTFAYSVDGATLSGTPSITCAATATSPVGTYDIVIAKGDVTNSEVTYVNGTLTITKASLTITAKNDTIKRGQDLPTFEVEYSGFKNNETDTALTKKPTITCVATSDSLAGTYPIVVSGGEAKNYELKYVNGTLTITDDVVVTAKSYTRVYGDANPTFEFTSDGATLSGTPSITCAATATSPVGTYDIVIAKGDVTNSEVTYVNGTLTITKAPLTITAKSYTIKQGGTLPTFEVEYAGFKNNETEDVFKKKPTITCEAKPDTVPGTYQIVVSDAEAQNYEMEYVFGSLTITDDVVVTAKSYTRIYGETNPTFEYTTSGSILSGEPSITCEATATSPVGTYPIAITKGSITNSDVTFVGGTLTITKAPLTITAKSYSVKLGKDLPTLELEYSGFKNNETDTVFTTKPTVSTRATKNSDPGTYDITVSGAEAKNYEIKYVNGTLTITAKTETFDGGVLTVEEGGNIDDAFETIGGRDEAAKTITAIIWNSSTPITSDMLEGLDNPNMLIYVQSKKQAPKDRNNVVINGVASYVKLTDIGTGNLNFYVPMEFVADSISYTREFKQATRKNVSRGWESICLPFTVQTFTHESHGAIAPFGNSESNYHFWLHQFTEDGVINAKTIEANMPYIISMPNSPEYFDEFNQGGKIKFASADVTVPVTETMSVLLGDSVRMIPTFQTIEKSASVYALNVGDSIISNLEGSIFVSNYRDIKPFEVYTFHEQKRDGVASSRVISVSSLFGNGINGTTGMDIMTKESSGDVWYNLNGQRLQSKPSKSGLYIHNGKKVLVK